MAQQKQIFIIDDTLINIKILSKILGKEGYGIDHALSGAEGLQKIQHASPDLIILDINMPGLSGFEVCHQLKENPNTQEIPIIFLTGDLGDKSLQQGFEAGAADYIAKPFNTNELLSRVKTQVQVHSLIKEQKRQNLELSHRIKVAQEILLETKERQGGPLLGSSPAVLQLRKDIADMAQYEENLLLTSLPGSGGEFVARSIHDASSRHREAFIYINSSQLCSTGSTGIISLTDRKNTESKLELATKGTLFIDRINEMPAELQDILYQKLSFFQEQDIRIISLSSRNLKSLVRQKKFHAQLESFLSQLALEIPSLTERQEDLEILAEHYLHDSAAKYGKNITHLSEDAKARLHKYSWPGNISEMISIIESQVIICHDSILEIPDSVFYKGVDIGGYKLIRQFNSGGMGDIWLAEHSLIGRKAAVKLIQRKNSKLNKIQRRFMQEAKAIAQLSSPHSITLYDFGIRNDGSFYYVMELLNGFDLQQLVSLSGPLNIRRAIYILRQVCFSLTEAHHKGIIHRDIKPENIFVSHIEEHFDFVKVLDFGIAEDLKDNTRLKEEEKILGTPYFIAPEIFLGDTEITPSIDLYALASVAYWMLSSKILFSGDSAKEICLKHCREKPLPIREFAQREDIPEELEDMLLRCLAKEDLQRPSCKEFLDLLIRLDEENPWPCHEAKQWWLEHIQK